MAAILEGKVAVVTGGAAGMGLATAQLFLEQGAKVVIGDLLEGETPTLKARFGDHVSWLRTDVLFEDDLEQLVAHAVGAFGGLDILFNNAGYGGTIGEIDQLKMESVDRTIGVLLKGVIHGYKHGVAAMKVRGGGSIISTASIAGLTGGAGPVIYSVCKAAVVHLAKCAAIELAPHRIRSNAICPGAIRTQLLSRAYGVSKDEAEPFRAFLADRAQAGEPIPRIGEPDDIAQTALFLAGPASRFITGQAIAVDGGYTADPAADQGQRAALSAALNAFRARAGVST